MNKHVASCSFGKDSVATVLLAVEHGEPLDEAVYCEVMFDDSISGEIPEHIDFIREKAIPTFERYGIKTVVLRSGWTYLRHFTARVSKGPRAGKIRGFPLCGTCTICRDCKLPPIRRYLQGLPNGTIQYIGIAKDEQERLMRLDGTRVSLLDKYSVTEQGAKELCQRHGLLSPIYDFTARGGCWFCPNAKRQELRHLYDHHKDLWARMMQLQALPNKCSELFNRTQRFSDIDRDFRLEDQQVTIFDILNQ